MQFKKQENFDRLASSARLYESYGFPDLNGQQGNATGEVYVTCPACSADRKEHNQDKRCCSVNVRSGLWHCCHCGESGHIQTKREYLEYLAGLSQRQLHIEPRRDRQPAQPRDCPRPVWHGENLIGNFQLNEHTPTELRDVLLYLTERRQLPIEVLQQARVTLHLEEFDGRHQYLISFNYWDRGTFVNWKMRSLDKKFCSFTGGETIPYNIDAILRQPVCYITEGEMDTLSLMAAGFPEAISVPNGGGANLDWLEKYAETHFDDKQQIYICSDMDEKGMQMLKEAIRRLGDHRCLLVCWDEGCKDANDEFCQYGAEGIRRCIDQAVPVPVSGVVSLQTEEVERRLDHLFEHGLGAGNFVGLEEADKKFRLEAGRFVVVTGRPGEGKSEFVDELALRLSLLYGWKTAYFSPENTPLEYHLAKLVSKLTGYEFKISGRMTRELYAGCKKWLGENVYHIFPDLNRAETVCSITQPNTLTNRQLLNQALTPTQDDTGNFYLNNILEVARQAVLRKGVRQIVIDPFNSIDPDPEFRDLNAKEWALHVCNACRNFANHYGCVVYLVAHPRKVDRAVFDGKRRRVEMNDISGSADFGNKCDYCLVVDRDDDIPVVTVFVDKVKFKQNGSRGHFYLHYDQVSGRYTGCTLKKLAPDLSDSNAKPKYQKDINWNFFNQRWINEQGEVTIRTYIG